MNFLVYISLLLTIPSLQAVELIKTKKYKLVFEDEFEAPANERNYCYSKEVKCLQNLNHNQATACQKKYLVFNKYQQKNLKGLNIGSYICFEESSHSVDYYKNGQKFEIKEIDRSQNLFIIDGYIVFC